jgi:hypothetical protein
MKHFPQAHFLRVTAASALTLGLVACGGGGGGSTPAPAPVDVLPTIPVTIPEASYPSGTAERGAYNVLQSARVLCGFGAAQQNILLDAASLAHAKYLVDLSFATGTSVLNHTETSGVAGFTGVGLGDRAVYQGYNYGALAEILEATSWDYRTQPNLPTMEARGASSMLNLMNTVYHLSGAMYEGRDVGWVLSSTRNQSPAPPHARNTVLAHL